jgi:hypothetical protein
MLLMPTQSRVPSVWAVVWLAISGIDVVISTPL